METIEPATLPENDVDRQLFSQLYEDAFPPVARSVSKMGGSFAEAREIFHDAIIAWYEKEKAGKIPPHVSPVAYLVGIAKHFYLKKFHIGRSGISLDENFEVADETLAGTDDKRLLKLLQQSGKACLDLLQAFYYDKLTAESLAATFKFGSPRSATVQKYKCLEKVRNVVKQNALCYEDFLE
jgi:DNA-directed RNA polymerase specialized sigma24 family protein